MIVSAGEKLIFYKPVIAQCYIGETIPEIRV